MINIISTEFEIPLDPQGFKKKDLYDCDKKNVLWSIGARNYDQNLSEA